MERWIDGLVQSETEYWRDGLMEYEALAPYPNTPLLQHSVFYRTV
jgi:hypothetical protein